MSETNTVEESTFSQIKKAVAEQFNNMLGIAGRSSGKKLFVVRYDRDEIWDTYINNFEADERQEHQCSSCKSFVRQAGGMVAIDEDNSIITLWDMKDHDIPNDMINPMAALDQYIRSCPLDGQFLHECAGIGCDKNLDSNRGIWWQHFRIVVPKYMVRRKGADAISGGLRDSANLLHRALEEITDDSVDTVLELIGQGSLYRGEEHRHIVEHLRDLKREREAVSPEDRTAFAWRYAATHDAGKSRVRNTVIGSLLVDISKGEKDLDGCVASYEAKVAPSNYKRPTALVTPRMVNEAKAKLEEMGLISALDRRVLDDRDLTAANALFTYRPTTRAGGDVFDDIVEEAKVDPRRLEKTERVGIDDFIANVVPTARSMRVLFEREHAGNLVTLTGPADPEANNLMKWDNSFCWSYAGGVADAIKERVKEAGGRVDDVFLRMSLAWHNTDDLDLHLKAHGEHVYFGAMRSDPRKFKAHLDVDMNAGSLTREPVENIYIEEQPRAGTYTFYVHQYTRRDERDQGFELELAFGDQTLQFGAPTNPRQGRTAEDIAVTVTEDGTVTVGETELSRGFTGMSKWGLATGQMHTVRALTLSPNHWTKPTGNKHWMFILEGCASDEKTRPFYNEFLTAELSKERKVTEVLGGKIEVAPSEGKELSGLGFSETVRNHLYVEVDGQFKRLLKVIF